MFNFLKKRKKRSQEEVKETVVITPEIELEAASEPVEMPVKKEDTLQEKLDKVSGDFAFRVKDGVITIGLKEMTEDVYIEIPFDEATEDADILNVIKNIKDNFSEEEYLDYLYKTKPLKGKSQKSRNKELKKLSKNTFKRYQQLYDLVRFTLGFDTEIKTLVHMEYDDAQLLAYEDKSPLTYLRSTDKKASVKTDV